jgi:predicted 2-oxoglutarate/Fe(II)-dependent dioxygenase YbiX
MSGDDGRFDLHAVERFFDVGACRRLIDEIRRAETSTALTFGKSNSGSVDERARKVRSATLDSPTVAEVTARLLDYLPHLRDHFGFPLSTIEEPQFLWYGPGDFFVAHQDGNTKLIQLESDRLRRVSLSIFLNQQSSEDLPDSYTGGSLVFTDHATGNRCDVQGETGKLVAFRSELTHEVTPIKSGDRFAVVTWCQVMA